MRRPNCIFWSNRCLRTAHEKSWLAEKKSETVFFLSKIEVTVSCAPAKPKNQSTAPKATWCQCRTKAG